MVQKILGIVEADPCGRVSAKEDCFTVAGENHGVGAGRAELRGISAILVVQRMMRVLDRTDALPVRDVLANSVDDARRLSGAGRSGEDLDIHARSSMTAVQSSSRPSSTLLRTCARKSSSHAAPRRSPFIAPRIAARRSYPS